MKILYGIQGTGNGHITRARAMAREMDRVGLEVDYLVSGRTPDKLFDMEAFGDFEHRVGLTFAVGNGRIELFNTVRESRPVQFLRDIRNLDLAPYDLVITDYEPITAWACRLRKKPVIGIGHQYAFRYPIPRHRGDPASRMIMRHFAPASKCLGLHWHHFGQPILPPIAPVGGHATAIEQRHIVVYLPFESVADIRALLADFDGHRFSIFHPDAELANALPAASHLHWFKPTRDGFQAILHRCEGVICNAGFELASETLQLGKKLLVKPVDGQTEQYSNALALELLGYGHTMARLDAARVRRWLDCACGTRIHYPNVAEAIALWLRDGASEPIESLSARLWQQTRLPDLTSLTREEDFTLATTGRHSHG